MFTATARELNASGIIGDAGITRHDAPGSSSGVGSLVMEWNCSRLRSFVAVVVGYRV